MRSVSITVTGRVQGVWFRKSAKDEADRLGLSGFVRNERDGSVYIEATGPSGNIEEFVEWCRRGPELARVDHVNVTEARDNLYSGFHINR